jgi:hypothetical protein
VLDLYERYTGDGDMFLTGVFGGVKLFIYRIKGAHPDDRCWRLYFAPRAQGVERDRARPTARTRPAPTGWAGARERQSLAKSLSAIGMQARFDHDVQRELGLEDDLYER